MTITLRFQALRLLQAKTDPTVEEGALEAYSLHPTPCTLHPALCTLHPTPHTLHPTPYTLHPTSYTLNPKPYTLNPTLHPKSEIPNPNLKPKTRNSKSETPIPNPETRFPNFLIPIPRPETRDPKLETEYPYVCMNPARSRHRPGANPTSFSQQWKYPTHFSQLTMVNSAGAGATLAGGVLPRGRQLKRGARPL